MIELLEALHGHAPLEGAIVRENGIGAAAQNAPAAVSFRTRQTAGRCREDPHQDVGLLYNADAPQPQLEAKF